MKYSEAKKILDSIRNSHKYGGEVQFRMAVYHLIDTGMRNFTPEIVESTCKKIDQQDDSNAVMTNDYQKRIVRRAAEIAKSGIDITQLLVYIQREFSFDVGDFITADTLAYRLARVLEEDYCTDRSVLYDRLESLGADISPEELKYVDLV